MFKRPRVAAIGPAQARKRLRERRVATLPLRIVLVEPHEHADAPHAVAPLRECRNYGDFAAGGKVCERLILHR